MATHLSSPTAIVAPGIRLDQTRSQGAVLMASPSRSAAGSSASHRILHGWIVLVVLMQLLFFASTCASNLFGFHPFAMTEAAAVKPWPAP